MYSGSAVAVALPRRMGTLFAAFALTLGFVAVTTVTHAKPAHAICVSTPLRGDWHNIIASTNAMTRVVVSLSCPNGHNAYWVRAWGRCHPSDCDWGTGYAAPMGDGWIRAIYDFGFKTSHVWLRNYSYYGRTYLRVYVFNDFTPADGRTDYTTDEWMLK